MATPRIVSRDEWLEARLRHLEREKEFTRLRDQLSAERRALPWVRIEKTYRFDTPRGEQTLSDLFDGRSQLIVQHFMFGPDWDDACPMCSFWADNYNGATIHMNHRDVTFVAMSRAPLEKIEAYKKRMGWTFPWVSSYGSHFNYDFHVSFTPEQREKGETYYNYRIGKFASEEAPGASVFIKDADGRVYHTYSCYGRGLDILNTAYNYIDLTPKGRDEDGLSYPMAWVRRHDQYED